MGIFVSKDMVVEIEIEGVKFRIRPLSGEEEDTLQDLAGEYKIVGKEEKFVTNIAKMRTEKVYCALTGDGCGWSAPEPVTKVNLAMLKAGIRQELCEEIDKLSAIGKGKKKESEHKEDTEGSEGADKV